jgi:hypothetical protein
MAALQYVQNGRKQNVGKLTFIKGSNQIMVCVGYCPDGKHKILITLDEAREFSSKFRPHGYKEKKLLRALQHITSEL